MKNLKIHFCFLCNNHFISSRTAVLTKSTSPSPNLSSVMTSQVIFVVLLYLQDKEYAKVNATCANNVCGYKTQKVVLCPALVTLSLCLIVQLSMLPQINRKLLKYIAVMLENGTICILK